jgi:hypothetical protein
VIDNALTIASLPYHKYQTCTIHPYLAGVTELRPQLSLNTSVAPLIEMPKLRSPQTYDQQQSDENDACLSAMREANADLDETLSIDEFLHALNLLAGNTFGAGAIEINADFFRISCLCRQYVEDEDCYTNRGLVSLNMQAAGEHSEYLQQICSLITRTIE